MFTKIFRALACVWQSYQGNSRIIACLAQAILDLVLQALVFALLYKYCDTRVVAEKEAAVMLFHPLRERRSKG
jgi:hypothetical protein